MAMIGEKDRETIREWFQRLVDPVRLVVFTQEFECEYCKETRELVEVHDLVGDAAAAEAYGIDKIPAIAIVGARDYGVRYYGFPGGYEFTTLVEDIIDVSRGEHGLSDKTVAELARLDRPVHLQVFVTPT
jgi:alkyl hydroperoxide reductase subunit AhpF